MNTSIPNIVGASPKKFADINASQFMKAALSMVETEAGIVIVVNAEQPSNAPCARLTTDDGIVMDGRPVQYKNAYSPILVMDSGRVTAANTEHP